MSQSPTMDHLKTKLVFSRGLGEIVTDLGARGTTFAVKKLLSGPRTATIQFLKEHLVLPNLDKFEATIDKLIPGVQTPEDRQDRLTQPPHVRALEIARSMFDLSTDFVGGYLIQVVGQQALDDLFKIPRVGYANQAKFALVDRAAQIGSFVLLNPVGASVNKAAQKPISGFIQRLMNMVGMPIDKAKADDYASHTVNVRLTNAIGSAAGGMAQYYHTKNLSK